jgi:transcriptional regulator with XRE-family HTH domain
MTDTFGARLRRERECRQIALADIASRTKIKASLFEALERDDASQWPSGIFRRSFLRAYAEAVGLDADETLKEFLKRFPDPAAQADEAPAALSASAESSRVQVVTTWLTDASASAAHAQSGLRLTLVETGLPFTGGRFLADAKQRWSAAAWDLGSVVAIALSIFVFMDAFWVPFGLTALCYYIGGVLVLGNSPGVCLFAPKPEDEQSSDDPRPARVPRHRAAEPPVRATEPLFRTSRFRAERHREARG